MGTEGDAAVRAATITFRPIDRYSLNKMIFNSSYRFTHMDYFIELKNRAQLLSSYIVLILELSTKVSWGRGGGVFLPV